MQNEGESVPPVYEVKELDDHGNMTAGSITDVDEDMISVC